MTHPLSERSRAIVAEELGGAAAAVYLADLAPPERVAGPATGAGRDAVERVWIRATPSATSGSLDESSSAMKTMRATASVLRSGWRPAGAPRSDRRPAAMPRSGKQLEQLLGADPSAGKFKAGPKLQVLVDNPKDPVSNKIPVGWQGADLSAASLQGASLSEAQMQGAKLAQL